MVQISLAMLAFAAITLACGGRSEPAPQPPQFGPAPVVSAALAAPAEPAEEFTGVLSFADLPELCQRMIADFGSYPEQFDWHGCALCTRAVGVSLADARVFYAAANDRAFLDALNLKRVASGSR